MPKPARLRPKSNVSTRRDGDGWRDALYWWSFPDLDFDFDDFFAGVAAVLALVAIVFCVVTIVFPIVAITLELVILVILFTTGLIGRLFFGRPWRIEATTIGAPKLRCEKFAKGLRGSREAVDLLADAIRSGSSPP
jgi:hypothetical protein